jgi:hypothetical protein
MIIIEIMLVIQFGIALYFVGEALYQHYKKK